MGDFGMSQLQRTETVQVNQESEETKQKKYQESLMRGLLNYDVRRYSPYFPVSVHIDQSDWKHVQEKAGTLDFIMPTGVAIGSPVQQEPAEDDKTKKDRAKKLNKFKKKSSIASHGSVVLQEKVSQNLAFRSDMAKQRKKEEKKGKDKDFLDKEDAKQSLIRAFSNDVRTDKKGKPIDAKNEEAQKNNEAFKNNLEGHMSQVVQWVYQVDLNPDKMLTDAYIQNHSSELFQTAERLKAFFDYYHRMGNEGWERGFLNHSAYVGQIGKEILVMKEQQAKTFLDRLSEQFKNVLSIDMETGKLLTDKERDAFAKSLPKQKDRNKTLKDQREAEQKYYQDVVKEGYKEFRKECDSEGEKIPVVDVEFKERYDTLIGKFNDSEQLKEYGNVAVNLRKQLGDSYDNLNAWLNINYNNPTIMGIKLQEARNQELDQEKKRMSEMLKACEEGVRFLTEGEQIKNPTTVDILFEAGYPADKLVEKVYRSPGGLLDQSNKIMEELDQRQESEQQRDERLLEQSLIVRQGRSIFELTAQEREQALQEVRSRIESRAITIEEIQELDQQKESEEQRDERLLKKSSIVQRKTTEDGRSFFQMTPAERAKELKKLTPAERNAALEEVRKTISSNAITPLLGRDKLSEAACRCLAKASGLDFNKDYAPIMRNFVNQTIHTGQELSKDNVFSDDKKSASFKVPNMDPENFRAYGTTEEKFTYHPVKVNRVLALKREGLLKQDSDGNFVGEGMDQAALDYVNYIDKTGMFASNDVIRYFVRMKKLIGDAKVFEVKDKDEAAAEHFTNQNFTAFLLQNFSLHYAANPIFGVPKVPDSSSSPKERDRYEVFKMITTSFQKTATRETIGSGYKEGTTMQKAYEEYWKMAAKVQRIIDSKSRENE